MIRIELTTAQVDSLGRGAEVLIEAAIHTGSTALDGPVDVVLVPLVPGGKRL